MSLSMRKEATMAKRGRPRKTPVYLTSEQIYDEWIEWKATGEVSEKMGEYMLLLANHMLMMP